VTMPESSPRRPTLDERIAAATDRLTPSEHDVAAYLSAHRQEVTFLSAAEIAAAVGVSDATVVRATQALGYGGLAHLKGELRDAIQQRATPTLRYRRSVEAVVDEESLLDGLVFDQIDLLDEARRSLAPADVRRAIDVVAGAERTFVVGLGPVGFAADYAALSLRRLGRTTVSLTGWGHGFADDLVQLRKGDALVVLAYEQLQPEHELALDRAAALSVPSVLVTDHLALTLAGRYEVALSAGRGPSDMAPSIAIPVMILEALVLGVVARDRDRALAALDELGTVRGQLESEGGR
jgi:DNA-binding MurR/RpiR family transcriptional regulator